MAANFIIDDKTKDIPRSRNAALGKILEGLTQLVKVRDAMVQGVDGSTGTAANFDLLAGQCGTSAGDYADANAACKASFDEIDSLLNKINVDTSVSGVLSAIKQAAAKHGVIQ